MREKLRSSKGMTLTELLVALVVVSLIGTALSVGINSAAKVYRDATQIYEAETLCGTIITCLEDEFRFGRNVHDNTNGDVVFDSWSFGNDVKVTFPEGKVLIGDVNLAEVLYVNSGGGNRKLLGDMAYTSGLKVLNGDEQSKISYNDTDGQVTIKIAVGPDDETVYAVQEVTVAPLEGPSEG